MAEAKRVEAGDWVTFRVMVKEAPDLDGDVLVDAGFTAGMSYLPVSAIVAVEHLLKDGDRVLLRASPLAKGEILRVRESTAVVLWDGGAVSTNALLEDLQLAQEKV